MMEAGSVNDAGIAISVDMEQDVLQMLHGIYQLLEKSLVQSDRIEKKVEEVEKRVERIEKAIQKRTSERGEGEGQGYSCLEFTPVDGIKCEPEEFQEDPETAEVPCSSDFHEPMFMQGSEQERGFESEANWKQETTECAQDEMVTEEASVLSEGDPLLRGANMYGQPAEFGTIAEKSNYQQGKLMDMQDSFQFGAGDKRSNTTSELEARSNLYTGIAEGHGTYEFSVKHGDSSVLMVTNSRRGRPSRSDCGNSASERSGVMPANVSSNNAVCSNSLRTATEYELPGHQGKKEQVCPICKKVFTLKGNMVKHLRATHWGVRPFSCDICNKAFSRRSHLKAHVHLHTGERPYCCKVCGKSFSQKGALRAHMTLHTREKIFSCDVCGITFATKRNLATHRRVGHLPGITLEEEPH